MNKLVSFLLVCLVLACNTTKTSRSSTNDAQAANDDGWIDLFDGKTTNGWHSYGKTHVGSAWKIENGVLHLDGASKKKSNAEGGDMVTNEEYENFDLKLEWKISPKGNSGVIFYVKEDGK